jgi:RNA polymerase sigma factor (sigma-70 family)
VETEAANVHEILQRYLKGTDVDDPEALLAQLVVDHAQPVVRRVVARRLYRAAPDQVEDLCHEALAALIGRLRALRGDPAGPVIEDFGAYAAGVTSNAVNRFLANLYPEHNRIRRRLRLVCTTDRRLRIWETPEGMWLCGRSDQSGAARAPSADLEACRRKLATVRLPHDLADLLVAVLRETRLPVELNALTQLCAAALGVVEQAQDVDSLEQTLVDAATLASYRTEMAAWIRHVWGEIRELPPRQRMALLLNLRSAHGPAIELIEDLGIATFGELAAALEISKEELAELWNRLPLDDKEIGARLGVERQQVINLRSSARQRLQRRAAVVPISGTKGRLQD